MSSSSMIKISISIMRKTKFIRSLLLLLQTSTIMNSTIQNFKSYQPFIMCHEFSEKFSRIKHRVITTQKKTIPFVCLSISIFTIMISNVSSMDGSGLQYRMGGVESTEAACRNGYERFRFLGRAELYHFGEVDLFYDELSRQEVMRTIYEFALGVDTEEEVIGRLRANNNSCPHLIPMVKIETQARSICAATNAYHVYFEYLPRTLQQIIDGQTQPFAEPEVRLLLSSLLEAVRFINDRETYHGDIYPEFIYLDERGQRKYKIFDSAYFNPLKHGYYRALEQASYCSPEVLANVSERRTFPLYNHFVSDTFSIGLVCLYAMTLISPLAAYKARTKEIDYYYIEMLLRIANRNGFSSQLLSCVSLCVQLKNRPTAAEILDSFEFLRGLGTCQKLSLRK